MKYLLLFCLLMIGLNTQAQESDIDRANRLADEDKLDEAIALADSLIAVDSMRAEYHMDRTSFLLLDKQYDKAVQDLSAAIRMMPDSATLYDSRGYILEQFMMFEEALYDFTQAYERAPKDDLKLRAHILTNRGGTRTRVRDFQGAYDDLVLAAQLDSTNIHSLNNLAAVCDEVGRPEETLLYLKKIIEIDSTYTPAYVNLGFKYQLMEDYKTSIQYFNKAIELEPDEGLSYSNRSFSRYKLNDLKGANEDIEEAIRLFPANSYAYKNKALIKIAEEDFETACKNLAIARDLGYTAQYGEEVDKLMKVHCKPSKQN